MKKFISVLLAAALVLALGSEALAAAFLTALDGEEELVSDAFAFDGDDGMPFSLRIPKVELPGAGAVNDAIWQDLYEGMLGGDAGRESLERGLSGGIRNMYHDHAVNGDVLSLWVTVELDANDIVDFYVYNVSLSDGARLEDGEVLESAGVDRARFAELTRAALTTKFYALYGGMQDDFTAEQLARTQSEENLQAAVPFLDANGALCVIGRVYAVAGAEFYSYKLTLPTGQEAPAAPAADQRLVWFIEHSDTQDLSESDLAGFSEQMCVYARNGVYARSGRQFLDKDLQSFFLQFDWYSPSIPPEQFSDAMLNGCQIRNIALVMAYEAGHGY